MANQAITPVVDNAPPRRVGRTIVAILAGFLTVVFLSLGTDAILHLLNIFPPLGERMADNLFVWATVYRTIYGVLGGYITARLAPYRPMWHAMVGAVIGMCIGAVGAVATWNKDLGPHWYSVALVLTGIPCAWIGGKIREVQLFHSQS
jgi:surface polysaccharide O-acyltransferase-like enzyme